MKTILNAADIPAELKKIPRWLLWKLEDRNGKPTKTPYTADGRLAKVNDPSTWTTFENALLAYQSGQFDGIGLVLSDEDDLAGVDLDKCLNPDTGELEAQAARIVADLPTYCEISPSGCGLRLFGFGKLPQGGRRKGKIELYETGRYLTVTGHRFGPHESVADISAEIAIVHARIFGKPSATKPAPSDAGVLALSDADLLEKIRRSKKGPDFEALWSGQTAGHGEDHSAADLALANILSFWTNGDAARMDRLFRQSSLMREKWDKPHYADGRTYGQATLEKAVADLQDGYRGKTTHRGDGEKPSQKPAQASAPVTERPTIHIQPGREPWMADEAERYLIKHDDGIFQRGDCLVRWSISKQETVHGLHRPDGVATIKPIDVEHLLDRLERYINWVRWDQRTKADVPTNAPRLVALKLLKRDGEWKFPILVGVITTPTLRPDGSILDKPGYDEITGLLYVERQPVPPIPANPSREEARQSLDFLINEVLAGFPFLEPHHRSAALSALLSVTVRHTLRHTPLHAFTAPKAGSGKSLLANCVALLGTGRPAAVLSLCEDQGEMNKAITSLLMQGDAVVNLDNIERGEALEGREICKAITGETYSGRLLGFNKHPQLASSCLWLATGNALQIAGDMIRRVVLCEIDPECERPDEREFTRDLYEWIPEHRPALVRAALTVLRAYVVAGKPRQPVPPLGGFEDWSNLVRSSLIWLGEADPLAGRAHIEEADPERSKLKALLLAWHRAFGSFPTTSKEAVYKATPRPDPEDRYQEILEAPELREVLLEFFKDRSGNPSSRYLGEYISQNSRRVEAGARFEAAGIAHSARLWKVVIDDLKLFERSLGESGESGESLTRHARDFAVSNRKEGEIEGMRNIGTGRELTPKTPLTPRKPASLSVDTQPPLTPNERETASILRELRRKHAENLKSGGNDPDKARVATGHLVEALRAQKIDSSAIETLKSRGLIVEEHGFLRLVEPKRESVS